MTKSCHLTELTPPSPLPLPGLSLTVPSLDPVERRSPPEALVNIAIHSFVNSIFKEPNGHVIHLSEIPRVNTHLESQLLRTGLGAEGVASGVRGQSGLHREKLFLKN